MPRFLEPSVLAEISSLDLVARTVVDGFVAGLHRAGGGDDADRADRELTGRDGDQAQVEPRRRARGGQPPGDQRHQAEADAERRRGQLAEIPPHGRYWLRASHRIAWLPVVAPWAESGALSETDAVTRYTTASTLLHLELLPG